MRACAKNIILYCVYLKGRRVNEVENIKCVMFFSSCAHPTKFPLPYPVHYAVNMGNPTENEKFFFLSLFFLVYYHYYFCYWRQFPETCLKWDFFVTLSKQRRGFFKVKKTLRKMFTGGLILLLIMKWFRVQGDRSTPSRTETKSQAKKIFCDCHEKGKQEKKFNWLLDSSRREWKVQQGIYDHKFICSFIYP